MAIDIQDYTGIVNPKDYGAVGDGVTDDTAAIQAAHNANGRVVLSAGTYRIGDVTLTSVPKISALIPNTVKFIIDSTKSGFIFNPPVAEVLSSAVAVTAIWAGQTAGADDLCDRITVASIPAGLKTGDLIHITSNDSIPWAANVWAGETAIVAYIDDGATKYIYTAQPLQYRTSYVTSPLLSKYTMTHADGYVKDCLFEANGDYKDVTITTRSPAIDVTGAPRFQITGCDFRETWAQAAILRTCPLSVVKDNRYHKLPNLGVYDAGASQKTITAATNASPAVFTSNAHGYSNGDAVVLKNGTAGWAGLGSATEYKGYRIANKATNTFQLVTYEGTTVDSTSFGAYGGDLVVSLADVRGFGYAPASVYGPSMGIVIDGSVGTGGRHDGTTDARGASYSTTTNRHRQGCPTYVRREGATTHAAIGVPNDTHQEGGIIEDTNRTAFGVIRGAMGGSYQSIGQQIRAKRTFTTNSRLYDCGIGVRITAFDHEEVPFHYLENIMFYNMKDTKTTGSMIRIDSQAAITNKPIVVAKDWSGFFVQRAYRFGANSNFRGEGTHSVYGPDIRVVCMEGANSTIDFDRLQVDYRAYTGGSNGRVIFVDDNGTNPHSGNVLNINELSVVMGDSTAKPNTLVDLSGTISGVALTLQIGRISIFNPSAIALPAICGSGDYAGFTFNTSGMDCIELHLAQPQTALTTSLKASRCIDRPFIPAVYVANVDTVSSLGLPTFDVNKNGTSVFGANKLTIDVSETTSKTAATAATIATASLTPFVAGDIISADCDVAGTGTAGGHVYVYGWFV